MEKTEKAQKYKYMHMMDGLPASYDGDQIVFCNVGYPVWLVPTLEDIRRERRESRKWRAGLGLSEDVKFSHLRVYI